MPLLRNVFSASIGALTIGSPRKLKDVFMTSGTSVASPNFSISR